MPARGSARRRLGPAMLVAALLTCATPATGQPGAQAPGDPTARTAPAPGQVLSLPEAIAIALRQHPSIRVAVEGQAAARARIGQARSPLYPKLDWVNSVGRTQTFSTSSDATFESNPFSSSLQANQLLWDFGKTSAGIDEARANVRGADGELERVRDSVVLNVRQTYLSLLQARRLVRVADAQVARAELNLRSARGFFEVGTKPKSDVTKAEVELANARVGQIRARNLVRFSEVSFSNALGLEQTVVLEIQDILSYEPVALDPAALLTEALHNRPELAQAQARVEAAQAQLAGARAGLTPDLRLVGSVGPTYDTPPLRESYSVALTLSWNLFQGYLTKSKIEETQALVEAARASYNNLELQVRQEVEQFYIVVNDAGERIIATDKAVESARENLRLAQGRYDAGVGTILDLTEAQLSLTNAEADQIRALTDFRLGQAALERAVGRR